MKKLLFTLSFVLFALSLLPQQVSAQSKNYPAEVGQAEFLGQSLPLRELAPVPPSSGERKAKMRRIVPKEIPNFTGQHRIERAFEATAQPKGADPLRQSAQLRGQQFSVVPSLVFDGPNVLDVQGVTPPDPCGDHNGEFFVQMTNAGNGAALRVYDREGEQVFNLPSLNMLWSTFGATGLGDPIVLWDHAAGRWLISEFQNFAGNALLVAVSKDSDPMGSWYAYRFQTPYFPDYPKYAVWDDAYIVTTNEPSDDNVPVYALQRSAMLQGDEAEIHRMGVPKFGSGSGFQVTTPVDWDGNSPPPPGSPGYVVRIYDDAWEGGQDKVELWEVNIDWDSGNSFISGPNDMIGAPFDSEICPDNGFFDCIEQPNGQLVDGLKEIILHRVPYLNFGSHESMLLHFAVDVDGNYRAGLRWMELRRQPGGSWAIHQEGTYTQDDEFSRFAGAISMDFNGNILMAYSVGGPSKNLSLRFTGRRASDPLGEMTIEEYEFAEGLSAQGNSRWGDYAAMCIDPQSGLDFWFTGPYMGGGGAWHTKIMSASIRRDSNDIGVQALMAPRNSGYLTDAETVQVALRNYGYKPLSDIKVAYQLDGGPLVEELVSDTLLPDSTYVHTFGPTVDLSAIGSYDFLLISSHPADTTVFNDTLRTRVQQLPRNDASIVDIEGLGSTVCDTTVEVQAILRNAGVDTLTAALISYSLNGQAAPPIAWSGSLAPGQREALPIALSPLLSGANELAISVAMPNGVVDENSSNDSREIEFDADLDGLEVVFRLFTDTWPEETTWAVRDEAGNLLYSGGPYQETLTLNEYPLCLPDACFTLTIFDSFGDGLSGPPSGNVTLLDANGNILAQLSEEEIDFGDRIDFPFCSFFSCQLAIEAATESETAAGANNGRIILSLANGVQAFEYSIDGGETYQPSPVFNDLSGGTYHCFGRDVNGCTADTVIELSTCALSLAAEVTDATGQAANGAVTVIASGAQGELSYRIDNGIFQADNTFSGLAAGEYSITVRDEAGCEQTLTVVVEMLTNARSRFLGQSVKLYPNPTEGFVQVEIRGLNNTPFLPVRIFNTSGQVVRHSRLVTYGALTRGTVSLYGLPAGAYFLRFEHAELPHLHQVVRQ
jgi:hypothetical protein